MLNTVKTLTQYFINTYHYTHCRSTGSRKNNGFIGPFRKFAALLTAIHIEYFSLRYFLQTIR